MTTAPIQLPLLPWRTRLKLTLHHRIPTFLRWVSASRFLGQMAYAYLWARCYLWFTRAGHKHHLFIMYANSLPMMIMAVTHKPEKQKKDKREVDVQRIFWFRGPVKQADSYPKHNAPKTKIKIPS